MEFPNHQGNLRKNGESINNQGGALLHHNSPIPWSTFAQYLTRILTPSYYD
ncbi:helicase [Yersinia enterocolitica]|nr:helicase [Yersinia enterocolitica]